MDNKLSAKKAFRFYTRLNLTELTGLKATNLRELMEIISTVPGSSIYHHTHRFLQQHQFLSPEPTNDFAYWVNEVLGEDMLGEQLASIDTVRYSTIRALREKIMLTIKKYLDSHKTAKMKFSNPGEEFYFMKSLSFILPTDYVANDLEEFVSILKKITINSIYYHIFESRLRLEKEVNDFSFWIDDNFKYRDLAEKIAQLDPYTYTLEGLRKTIVKMTSEYICNIHAAKDGDRAS